MAQAVELAVAMGHALVPEDIAEGDLSFREVERVVSEGGMLGERVADCVADADMGVADIPATADARRHVLGGAQLELHAVLDLEGVGVVGGVGGGVIEVAVLAEEAFEAAALLAEVGGVEGVALVQVGAAPAGSDEAVGHGREADIGDGVEAVDGAGVYRVGQAGLAGVLGREDVVGHAAAEETVVAERVGGHLDAHFGVDGRDVDRCRGEVAEEPAAELAPAVGECGVEPESRLYGPAQARRAEERSVGGIAQHGVDFGLDGLEGGLADAGFFGQAVAGGVAECLAQRVGGGGRDAARREGSVDEAVDGTGGFGD